MRRKLKNDLLYTFLFAFMACSIVFLAYALKVISDAPAPSNDRVIYVHKSPEVETVTKIKTETKLIPVKMEEPPETVLSTDDLEALAAVVHNEAGNQDMIGRRLVADVVLNRCDSDQFPDTVQEVVSQKGQFKFGGSYTDEDMEAVKLECEERLDYDVLYFKTGSFHRSGDDLYQHGDHYFSGR